MQRLYEFYYAELQYLLKSYLLQLLHYKYGIHTSIIQKSNYFFNFIYIKWKYFTVYSTRVLFMIFYVIPTLENYFFVTCFNVRNLYKYISVIRREVTKFFIKSSESKNFIRFKKTMCYYSKIYSLGNRRKGKCKNLLCFSIYKNS